MTKEALPELQHLNEHQRTAALTTEGRVLILAGAGSGKTRVLTMRMAHLIKNLGVPAGSILGLTFTNKAAAEMRHRVAKMLDGPSAKEITLCTFHSFCMKILRQEIHRLGYTNNFTLYDEKDISRLIGMIARDILKVEGELPSLAPTIAAINNAKSSGLRPEELSATENEWHDGFTQEVYTRLKDSMRAYNAVDFDSLLWLTVELFETFPDVLEKYQDKYRYVMIDEYQDTNPTQYKLATLLTKKYGNLCVVGDDDQSIYGWRGANVHHILEFGEATVVKLEQNYRSTNTILLAANAVIGNNSKRFNKKLWSNQGEGKLIEVFHAPTEVEEAQAVVCRIAKLKKEHALRWKDIAILYRSNALSRQFELALIKHNWDDHGKWVTGIPYKVHGGVEFYDRREVRDLVGYLRVIVNPKDQEALLRIINQPRRGIGEGALDALTAYNRKEHVPLWGVLEEVIQPNTAMPELRQHLTSKALHGLEDFVTKIKLAQQKFQEEPLLDTMNWLIEAVDYKRAINEEVKSHQMREFKWENVQEFVTAVSDYEDACAKDEKKPTLHDYITESPLNKSDWGKMNKNDPNEDKVNLLTFHSAKGLEFPACFLVGVEDHIIPHEKSVLETGEEEERRLMYVAITRAMRFLTITMARQRKRMGKVMASRPSRFLKEVPREFLSIVKWDDIS